MLVSQCLATALYLLPILALWVFHSRHRPTLFALGLAIPFALALDLLLVLGLSAILPLDLAALASRGVWLVFLFALLFGFRRALRFPAALTKERAAIACLAGASAAALSLVISRSYIVWDRTWHVPLVSSLGGQRLPFLNVFGGPLHYHVTGDVIAAMLRAFSGAAISSNLALSLSHDLLFALFGLTTSLFLLDSTKRRGWLAMLGGLLLLLQGPWPIERSVGQPLQGFSYHLFYSLSFRPHVPVAAILMLGIVGALWTRLTRVEAFSAGRLFRQWIVLFSCLAITDEASFLLLGLGLGVLWLAYPIVLGRSRARGFLGLLLLGLGGLLANGFFSGSLAPGGPVQKTAWLSSAMVPAVVPGPSLSFWTWEGARIFLADLGAVLGCLAGLCIAWRKRASRGLGPAWVLCAAVVLATSVLALHLRINGFADENQRFYVAPFLVTLPLAFLAMGRLKGAWTAKGIVLVCLLAPPVASARWIREIAPTYMQEYQEGERNAWAKETTYPVDCRKIAGARVGEAPRVTYVDVHHHYVYTSCKPILGAGRAQGPWAMKTLPIIESRAAWREAEAMGKAGKVDVVCGKSGKRDAVCEGVMAKRGGECKEEGERFWRCEVGRR